MGVVSWNILVFIRLLKIAFPSAQEIPLQGGDSLMSFSIQFCLNFSYTPAYSWGELQDNSKISELIESDGQSPHSFYYLGFLYSKPAT